LKVLFLFQLIGGFIVLIAGAEALIRGSVSIAKRFNISDMAIGLSLVSVGSSAPEVVVNIMAALKGSPDIAMGNVLGSNISNLLLGVGIASFFHSIRIRKNTVLKEIPFSVFALLVLLIMANDRFFNSAEGYILSRSEGLLLICFFLIFLYYIYSIGASVSEDTVSHKRYPIFLSILLVTAGILSLALGGQWIVKGARSIASLIGLSEAFIGLTLVAIGTSMPEIVTSAVAAYRNKSDIAIGNIIGSNVFNIFWVLGITATVTPIKFSPKLNWDIIIVTVATVMLVALLYIGKKKTIGKMKGIAMIVAYVGYILYLIHRG